MPDVHTKARQKTVNIFVDIESPSACILGKGANNFDRSKLIKIPLVKILVYKAFNACTMHPVAHLLQAGGEGKSFPSENGGYRCRTWWS
jgi:hypothetical protein